MEEENVPGFETRSVYWYLLQKIRLLHCLVQAPAPKAQLQGVQHCPSHSAPVSGGYYNVVVAETVAQDVAADEIAVVGKQYDDYLSNFERHDFLADRK